MMWLRRILHRLGWLHSPSITMIEGMNRVVDTLGAAFARPPADLPETIIDPGNEDCCASVQDGYGHHSGCENYSFRTVILPGAFSSAIKAAVAHEERNVRLWRGWSAETTTAVLTELDDLATQGALCNEWDCRAVLYRRIEAIENARRVVDEVTD